MDRLGPLRDRPPGRRDVRRAVRCRLGPAGIDELDEGQPESGFVLAALDIALSLPPAAQAPTTIGSVAGIYLATEAGAKAQAVDTARAIPDRGLDGDRHVAGTGTFPSGPPGSALALVHAEVCQA